MAWAKDNRFTKVYNLSATKSCKNLPLTHPHVPPHRPVPQGVHAHPHRRGHLPAPLHRLLPRSPVHGQGRLPAAVEKHGGTEAY